MNLPTKAKQWKQASTENLIQNKHYKALCLLFTYVVIPLLLYLSLQFSYFFMNLGYKKAPVLKSYFLGLFMFVAVYLIILAITKKLSRQTATMGFIIFWFLIIDQFKIFYTQDPVLIQDMFLLNDTGSIAEIMGETFFSTLLSMIPAMLIIALILFLIYELATLFQCSVSNKLARFLPGVISLALMLLMFIPNQNVTKFMNKYFFAVIAEKDNHTTTNIAYYNQHGIVSGLYGQLLASRFVKPSDYDKIIKELDAELNELNNEQTCGKWGQPNIIMVFSESFWDIDQLDDITFDKPITSNFNKLKSEGIFFDMISPSYGGISANVEFEMLTGSSIRYYGSGYIPYMQLMNSDFYYTSPSVIGVLNDNNYTTTIMSTWSDKLFNCKRAYEYFKVDNTIYGCDFEEPEKKGGRISEKCVADSIIKQMDSKKNGEKLFLMALTAQTHMPFPADRYTDEEYDINVMATNDLPDYVTSSLRCYAQGVYDADKQLGRLYEYIQTLDEPTLLIFYGDHLPYITDEDGSDAYPMLSFFNTDNELVNTYRKYNTQCLILGNFDLGEDDIEIMGPNLVMSYVLNNTTMNVPSFYKWLNKHRDFLPAGNTLIFADKNKKLYNAADLPNDMEEELTRQTCMNWKYFINQ